MQHLYRHFAKDGTLLYVGISKNAIKRLYGHQSKSFWSGLIAEMSIERFETREEALIAECKAIETEKPRYNKIYNRLTKKKEKELDCKLQAIREARQPQYTRSKKQWHSLDCTNIVEFGEVDTGQQIILVWCNEHSCYEWHWINRGFLKSDYQLGRSAVGVKA